MSLKVIATRAASTFLYPEVLAPVSVRRRERSTVVLFAESESDFGRTSRLRFRSGDRP
jgi:hypothetical protein